MESDVAAKSEIPSKGMPPYMVTLVYDLAHRAGRRKYVVIGRRKFSLPPKAYEFRGQPIYDDFIFSPFRGVAVLTTS
jgi:hypothetical protein